MKSSIDTPCAMKESDADDDINMTSKTKELWGDQKNRKQNELKGVKKIDNIWKREKLLINCQR